MLVLFETPAGFALFKVLDEGKLSKVENLSKEFSTADSARKLEARLRNLEGRELGYSAGSAKGKPKIEFYDKDRKKGAGALITPAKIYNPSADSILGKTESVPEKNEEEVVLGKRKKKTAEQSHTDEAPVNVEEKKDNKRRKKKVADADDTALPDADGDAEPKNEEVGKKEKKKKKKPSTEDSEKGAKNLETVGKKKKRKHAEADEETETPSKNVRVINMCVVT